MENIYIAKLSESKRCMMIYYSYNNYPIFIENDKALSHLCQLTQTNIKLDSKDVCGMTFLMHLCKYICHVPINDKCLNNNMIQFVESLMDIYNKFHTFNINNIDKNGRSALLHLCIEQTKDISTLYKPNKSYNKILTMMLNIDNIDLYQTDTDDMNCLSYMIHYNMMGMANEDILLNLLNKMDMAYLSKFRLNGMTLYMCLCFNHIDFENCKNKHLLSLTKVTQNSKLLDKLIVNKIDTPEVLYGYPLIKNTKNLYVPLTIYEIYVYAELNNYLLYDNYIKNYDSSWNGCHIKIYSKHPFRLMINSKISRYIKDTGRKEEWEKEDIDECITDAIDDYIEWHL